VKFVWVEASLLKSFMDQMGHNSRYSFMAAVVFATFIAAFCWAAKFVSGLWFFIGLGLIALGVRDLRQTRHAILRNYPIIGHMRFFFEFIRPEVRQYFIESDTEAIPFSRQQRAMVYQRSKNEADKRPFGTQLNTYADGYEWINHSILPTSIDSHDFRIVIGHGPQAYSASVFNISAMSFGALSANAILALNKGAKAGGFMHDTGEGSISQYHRTHGGDLVWEIGSGYFGCRNADGTFSEEKFKENVANPQVKLIEIKLSQGAKPGHGGVLPGAKVTPEIGQARGVPAWQDCVSPSSHSAFATPIELLQFVERLRTLSGGKPTGFKLAIGHPWEWFAIAKAMLATGITPDFIVIDGKEGGTGAAPAEFIDRVGTPMLEGLLLVHNTLVGINLRGRIKIGAAGKIVSAFDIARTLALGADWCNSARGFMFALGCIQAQSCHTGTCPTGVTTQDPQRQQALVVPDKAERVASFHQQTLHTLKDIVAAAGLNHPSELAPSHIIRRVAGDEVKSMATIYTYLAVGELLDGRDDTNSQATLHDVFTKYWPLASASTFRLPKAVPLGVVS
jgi:glutamate synthase domain-containing protein 2